MFEKLKEKLRMLTTIPAPFDPAKFGDPLASQIEWTPARRGGTNFRTHKLKTVGPSRVEFHASIGAILFSLLFFFLGLGVSVALTASWLKGAEAAFEPGLLVPLLLGLIFMAIGGYLFFSGTTPIVFEKGRGVFWKGRKGPDDAIDSRNTGVFGRIDDVYALQLIAEYVSGKNSYYSYELNLVLKDGKRINVVDHGNLDRIREDARTLSLFLGKPLWDATVREAVRS